MGKPASPAARSPGPEPGATARALASRAGDDAARPGSWDAPERRAVLELQRAAGNHAVTSLLTGAGAVQRAPDERPKDRSRAALGDTVAGPAAAIPALATSQPAPTVASPDALAATLPGAATPPPVFDRNAPLQGRAAPVTEADVAAAFQRDPASVIRSPSASWHNEVYILDKGTGGVPQAYRVGNQIAVHPDFSGPATPLPQYAAAGDVGLGKGGHEATIAPPPHVPKDQLPGSSTVGSVAPSSRGQGPGDRPGARIGRPEHWDTARPVTDAEVEEAYRANPASVIRSPSHDWHEEMYDFDEGTGDAYPDAFKVGSQIAVAPDHPGPATDLPHYSADGNVGLGTGGGQGGGGGVGGAAVGPAGSATGAPTASGGAPRPSSAAKAADTIGLPGTTYEESTPGRSHRSTVTGIGDQATTRDRRREGGMVTTGEETSDGELTHRKERVAGVGAGVGGNVVGAQYGRSETTTIDGGGGTTASSHGAAGITGEGKVQVGGERKREFTRGTRPDGTPDKTSSSTTGSIAVDTSSVAANVGHSSTGRNGREVSGGASFSADDKGNASVAFTGGMRTKSGLGASVTVGAGHTVTAEDPEEITSGVWEVRYVVADTATVGGGVSLEKGGIGAGANGSVTDADTKTGSRRFASEKEAKAFKEDAAARIAGDVALERYLPVTTVAGALRIPAGESRGAGDSRTKAGSVSGTFGASVSRSGQTSSGHELSVFHASGTIVQVTYTVTGAEGSDWGISGAGLSNQKGGSESTLYAVTYEFDLGSKEGAQAFQTFVALPLPPASASRRVGVHTLGTQEEHDKVGMLGGAAEWTGTTWQDEVDDDKGKHEKYGGRQSRNQDPGKLWKLLGDKELHSNAQIVRTQENEKEAAARAVFSVSGESGSFNREEFHRIFQDSGGADATASGQWTLSAPVPIAAIRRLEAVSPALRAAPTLDEKMKVYAKLVKKNGAQMLGGQVGISSKAWDLELKGDENFPGPSGREQVLARRKALADAVTAKPPKAVEVVRETGEELERLRKRRAAVADPKRYTDLPDGLRQQQLALIDSHIDEFQAVRRNAQAAAMRVHPEGTDAGNGRPGTGKADREYAGLQDRVHAAEVTIGALRSEVRASSRALGDAIGSKGTTAIRAGVGSQVAQVQIAMAKSWIKQATEADKRQAALDPRITELREAWTSAQDPTGRAAALTSLAQVLEDRVRLMRQSLASIVEAGKAVYPITTRQAMSGNPAFWQSLGMSEPADERSMSTSMHL